MCDVACTHVASKLAIAALHSVGMVRNHLAGIDGIQSSSCARSKLMLDVFPNVSCLQDMASSVWHLHHGVIDKTPGAAPNDPAAFKLTDHFAVPVMMLGGHTGQPQ